MNDDEKTSVKDFLLCAQAVVSGSASMESWNSVEFDGVTLDTLVKRAIEIAEEQERPPAPKGRRAAIEHTRRKHAEKQKKAEASEIAGE
jgi:hypothetical protein